MQRIVVCASVLALLVIAAPSTAEANNKVQVDVGLGVAHLMVEGEGFTGFGLGITPGYAVTNNLIVELDLGYHNGSDGPLSFGVIPLLMPGVSYNIGNGALQPFVDAHVGLVSLRSKVEFDGGGFFGGGTVSGSTSEVALNFGGGVDYMINDMIGIGGQLGVWMVMASETVTMIDAGVHSTFRF